MSLFSPHFVAQVVDHFLVDHRMLADNNFTVGDGSGDDLIDQKTDDVADIRDEDLTSVVPTMSPTLVEAITEQEKIGFAVLTLMTLVFCCGIFYCYSCCKRRREQKRMEMVNSRADSVLGDMVMVNQSSFAEEDDEAGELI